MSMTGTSVNTPTVVASAAGLVVPNNAIATATASSKLLLILQYEENPNLHQDGHMHLY